MSYPKTDAEIDILREGGKRLAQVLDVLEELVVPGVRTDALDLKAYELIVGIGDTPAFLNYKPEGTSRAFPASLCVSINNEIVHGIPNENPQTIQEGDIVGIDLGIIHDGLFTDSARTVIAGKGNERAKEIIAVTRKALYAGIDSARAGAHIGDIGYAVAGVVKPTPFVIIEELVGHGVGHSVHEEPLVPNVGVRGNGVALEAGMVLALEVMLAESGKGGIAIADDDFTYITDNGSRSTQIEHTILITTDGAPEILTLSKSEHV